MSRNTEENKLQIPYDNGDAATDELMEGIIDSLNNIFTTIYKRTAELKVLAKSMFYEIFQHNINS